MCQSISARFHCTHGRQQQVDEPEPDIHCEFGQPADSCPLEYSTSIIIWVLVSCEACRRLDERLAARLSSMTVEELMQGYFERDEADGNAVYDESEADDCEVDDGIDACLPAYNSNASRENATDDPPPYYDTSLVFDNVGMETDVSSNYQEEIWADRYFDQNIQSSASAAANKYMNEVTETYTFVFAEVTRIQQRRSALRDSVFHQMQAWKKQYTIKVQELLDREGRAQILEVQLGREISLNPFRPTSRRISVERKLKEIHRLSWTGSYNLGRLQERALAQFDIFQNIEREA